MAANVMTGKKLLTVLVRGGLECDGCRDIMPLGTVYVRCDDLRTVCLPCAKDEIDNTRQPVHPV